jgi:hypothetical protein
MQSFKVRVHRPELHVCELCGSTLVYLTDWKRVGPVHGLVTLRCPECEAVHRGVHHSRAVTRLMKEFDRGTGVLNRERIRLSLENQKAEVERFVSALGSGLSGDAGKPHAARGISGRMPRPTALGRNAPSSDGGTSPQSNPKERP